MKANILTLYGYKGKEFISVKKVNFDNFINYRVSEKFSSIIL